MGCSPFFVRKVPKSALNFLSLTAWIDRNIIPLNLTPAVPSLANHQPRSPVNTIHPKFSSTNRQNADCGFRARLVFGGHGHCYIGPGFLLMPTLILVGFEPT